MQTIELLTSAWHGDHPLSLDFPDNWRLQVLGDQSLPAMPAEELRQRVCTPVSGQPLRQIAVGHQRAAILIDDLSRPTPVGDILPAVMAELELAGIPPGQVVLVVAGGTHTPLDDDAVQKKLGGGQYPVQAVVSHDSRGQMSYLGKTARGTPLYLNPQVLQCDLRIAVGCIYPHPAAGFSGWAKALAPGVAGAETIRAMHDHLQGAKERVAGVENEFRQEAERIASQVGLHFIVNAALNQQRQVHALFAGDFLHAFRAGVDYVRKAYAVPSRLAVDITVADMYPFDADLQFAFDRGMWPLYAAPPFSRRVLLAACPRGLGTHVLYPLQRSLQARLSRRLKHFRLRDLTSLAYRLRAAYRLVAHQKVEVMLVSTGLDEAGVKSVFPSGRLFPDWDSASAELERSFPQSAQSGLSVAIYRCAPLMVPGKETCVP